MHQNPSLTLNEISNNLYLNLQEIKDKKLNTQGNDLFPFLTIGQDNGWQDFREGA